MKFAKVTSGGLNLRDSPNGKTVDVLNHYERVEILGGGKFTKTVEWLPVRVVRTGKEGYVAARFLELDKPDLAPVPKPVSIAAFTRWRALSSSFSSCGRGACREPGLGGMALRHRRELCAARRIRAAQ